jgi:hypothetical protein
MLDLTDRHPATRQAMLRLTPNPNLSGAARTVAQTLWEAGGALVTVLKDGPELSDGLRKLWEAKNCLVLQALLDSGAVHG